MKYKIAETPGDFASIDAMMKASGFAVEPIKFPTIMAADDEGLVGFIATIDKPDMVLAGPLVLRQDRRHVFTALRLITLYDQVMQSLGMKSIIFYADERDSFLVKGIKRWFPNVTPYSKKGTNLFYTWNIGGAV